MNMVYFKSHLHQYWKLMQQGNLAPKIKTIDQSTHDSKSVVTKLQTLQFPTDSQVNQSHQIMVKDLQFSVQHMPQSPSAFYTLCMHIHLDHPKQKNGNSSECG